MSENVWPAPLPALLLGLYFVYSYTVFLHLDRAYLHAATPLRWSLLQPLMQVLLPLLLYLLLQLRVCV